MDNCKVTVCVQTYNLEKYIEKCLESIISQKTDFDFHIAVADDCSTDNTVNILKEYQKKFPEKISLILKEKNEGSLITANKLFDNVRTPYFTFIDGDDYWCTETFLQDAVDFLDKHPDYTMYGGNTKYLKDGEYTGNVIREKHLDKTYTYDDYKNNKRPFVHTSALVLRNVVYNNGTPNIHKEHEHDLYNCVFRGEDFRFFEHIKQGKLYVSSKTRSVYRIHEGGIWQGASRIKQLLETCISSLLMLEMYPDLYENKRKLLKRSWSELMGLLSGGGGHSLRQRARVVCFLAK